MAGIPVYFPSVTYAAETSIPEQALEVFFQLGLPDTRGAKWVQIFGPEVSEETPLLQTESGSYTGNAWLVRDEPNGIVELVTCQGRRLRGKRSDKAAAEQDASDSLPEIQVQPANLEQDLKTLGSALQASKPSEGEDVDDSDERPSYQQRDRIQRSGGTLLFLAQLYRQGRADAARDLLRKLLSQRISADAILDSAVSTLADGRLSQCTQEWTAHGDSGTFAEALEKLAAEFSRGWDNREAVLLLAKRIREQKPSPATTKPAAKHGADLFLKLTQEQYRNLPRGRNWATVNGLDALQGEDDLSEELDTDEHTESEANATAAVSGGSSEKDTQSPSSTDPLATFFSRKREAIEVLALLLNDHRFLRVARNEESSSRSYDFSGDDSPEEALREAYDRLPRPIELGELAWELLEPILPDQVRIRSGESPEDRSAQVLEWLPEIASLDDEQLAWYFLRKTDNPGDEDFRTCLSYLIKHGNPETQSRLQEVFLDPAVWGQGSTDMLLPLLRPYLKRMAASGDVSTFQEKLKTVITTALERDEARMSSRMDERTRKYLEDRRTAELRKLDQLLKPRRLADMLDEFAAAKPEDRGPILQMIGTATRTAPWSEVEPALFQAAAKANDNVTKRTLLQLLQGALYSKNFSKAGKPELPPIPSDAPTREALHALLQDESVQEADDYREDGAQTVADTTASIFLWSRFRPEEQSEWMNLWRTSPQVASIALRAHARALVTGQPVPLRPNAANVPAEEVQKIVKDLSVLSPSEIHAAVRSKTPSEQLALILHLRQLAEWPASLRKAHFVITAVRADGEKAAAILQASKWQERQFDDAARQELEAAVEKAAQDGNTVAVAIQANDLLSGLTLSVRSIGQKLPVERLASMKVQGLEDKPAPVAVLFYGFRGGTGQEQMIPAHSSSPIWKDSATTQAWKDQYLKSEAKAEPSGAPQSSDTEDSYNSRSFEHRIQATLALKPSARGSFFIQWQAFAIQPTASASSDTEEP